MLIHIDPDVRRAILSEVVIARWTRANARRMEGVPNDLARFARAQAAASSQTISALRRVLEEVRVARARREAVELAAWAAERRCQLTYGGEYCGNPATVWDGALDRDLCDEHRNAARPGDLSELELRYAHGDR